MSTEVRHVHGEPDDGINLVALATVSVTGGDRYKIDDGPFGNCVIARIREERA